MQTWNFQIHATLRSNAFSAQRLTLVRNCSFPKGHLTAPFGSKLRFEPVADHLVRHRGALGTYGSPQGTRAGPSGTNQPAESQGGHSEPMRPSASVGLLLFYFVRFQVTRTWRDLSSLFYCAGFEDSSTSPPREE